MAQTVNVFPDGTLLKWFKNDGVSGGWEAIGCSYWGANAPVTPTLSSFDNGDQVKIQTPYTGSAGMYRTLNSINLADYSKLYIAYSGSASTNGGDSDCLIIRDNNGSPIYPGLGILLNKTDYTNVNYTLAEFDISSVTDNVKLSLVERCSSSNTVILNVFGVWLVA